MTQSPSLSGEYDEGGVAPRDVDERRDFVDERSTTGESTSAGRLPWPQPRSSHSDRFTSKKPSVVRRMFRSIGRFFLAVLIGVGATLSWQSYGNDAREMVRAWAPSLAWLIPLSTTKSLSPLAQQLQSTALDVAVVRRQIEQVSVDQQQLGANEVQIAESIARLLAIEQDVSQKVSSLSEPGTAHLRPKPPAHPTQSLNVH